MITRKLGLLVTFILAKFGTSKMYKSLAGKIWVTVVKWQTFWARLYAYLVAKLRSSAA